MIFITKFSNQVFFPAQHMSILTIEELITALRQFTQFAEKTV